MTHKGCHVFAAAFDSNTKRKHSATTIVRIGRGKVLLDKITESREHLGGGKIGRQSINNAKSRLRKASEIYVVKDKTNLHDKEHHHPSLLVLVRWRLGEGPQEWTLPSSGFGSSTFYWEIVRPSYDVGNSIETITIG